MKRTLKPGETVAVGNGFRVQQRETYYVMVDEAGHEYATGGGDGFCVVDEVWDESPEDIQARLEADAAIALEEARIDRQYAVRAMLDTPTYSFRSGFVFNSQTGEYIEAARPPKTGRR